MIVEGRGPGVRKRPIADVQGSGHSRAMSSWIPATKVEVERAVDNEATKVDPLYWRQFSHLLVEPYARSIERFGAVETAFVVAKGVGRVVYYDDIEDDFGTAVEVGEKLVDCVAYGALILALKEAASST